MKAKIPGPGKVSIQAGILTRCAGERSAFLSQRWQAAAERADRADRPPFSCWLTMRDGFAEKWQRKWALDSI
jgi:hypothetical protein